jgi:exosortase/archaeosortase family protein
VLTARVSGSFLNLIGVATEQQGSALQSAAGGGFKLGEHFSLDVDRACAGLRSLYALMMVSALFGYMFLNRGRSRLILFLCSLPLAMLGNFVRLMLLALGSMAVSSEFAVGRQMGDHLEMSAFHELAGYAVFAVALGGMFAVSAILERKPLETARQRLKAGAANAQNVNAAPRGEGIARGPLLAKVGAAMAVAVATLLFSHLFGGQPPISGLGVVLEMPRMVGNYQRVAEEGMTAKERDQLNDDVEMRRGKYLGGSGAGITAIIVTSGTKRRSMHPPEVCSPAQGYTITKRSAVPILLENGTMLQGRLLRMFKDYIADGTGEKRRSTVLQLYIYVGTEGVTANDYYEHVAISYLHAVFKGVNHRWAMVSCVLPVSDERLGESNPVAEAVGYQEVQTFAADLLPQVLKQ